MNVVEKRLLDELAAEVKDEAAGAPAGGGGVTNGRDGNGHAGGHKLNVPRWLSARGVGHHQKKGTDAKGRTVYVLAECPFDPAHKAPDACVMQDGAGKLYAKCLHNSCAGRGWQHFKQQIGAPSGEHYDPPMPAFKTGRDGGGAAAAGPAAAGDDIESVPMPPPWPTLHPDALHGLAGDIVRTIEPQTEADPVAVLGQLLAAFGSAAGRGGQGDGPYYQVEGDRHYANLFLATVGRTSHGRKGTAWSRGKQVMRLADKGWLDDCVRSGLVSGEGLIYFVRNRVTEEGEDGEPAVKDKGVADKRLFVFEGEFAQVLRVMRREGSTLSTFVRQAWDSGALSTLTRNNPLRATHAHVSIVGHVTLDELRRYLEATEMFNGFANRFLWLLVRRSKQLPDGGAALDLASFGGRLGAALGAARKVGAMSRDAGAGALWRKTYPVLTAERGGLYGAATSRAEAQVLRLSMAYALLDCSAVIRPAHLSAALALWDYADASALRIFGAEAEDSLPGNVLEKLRAAGAAGLSRTQLHEAFSRNLPADKLLAALATLQDRGLAHAEKVTTGKRGAPAERWVATKVRNERINSPPQKWLREQRHK